MTNSAGFAAAPHRSRNFSLRRLLFGMLVLCLLMAVTWTLALAVRNLQREAIRMSSQGPLNQMMLALTNYHEHYGAFPPAYVAAADGTPLHSWRVLILPFIEQQALYDAYDFNEPWNGPNNSKLINLMPTSFYSRSEPPSSTFTNLLAIVGPGTAFPGASSSKLGDFLDGPENTILLSEIANSDIPWLQPRDLDATQMSFRINDPASPSISAVSWREPYVVFADRITTYPVSREMPPEILRALTTTAGGEPVIRDRLVEQGLLGGRR